MKKADLWSLGVTIYCLTFNRLPFSGGNTEIETMNNICEQEISYSGRDISEELKQLLEMLLQKDPSQRVSITELQNAPFLTSLAKTKIQ